MISPAAPGADVPWSSLEGGTGCAGLPQPCRTFTPSDDGTGRASPGLAPAQLLLGKGPIPGRKGKSALNPWISKEVSGKNTSPARMLSNFFFFFFLLNKSYLYFQSSELVTRGSRPFGAQEPLRSLSCLQKASVEHCSGLYCMTWYELGSLCA